MSTAPKTTDLTQATATISNAVIVGSTTDSWNNAVVLILCDNGKTYRLDRRAINTRTPKIGQRGWIEYREYEFGSRWFFETKLFVDSD